MRDDRSDIVDNTRNVRGSKIKFVLRYLLDGTGDGYDRYTGRTVCSMENSPRKWKRANSYRISVSARRRTKADRSRRTRPTDSRFSLSDIDLTNRRLGAARKNSEALF